MALSEVDLDAAWTKARSKNGPQWVPYFDALRAVAALVRKDDEALIMHLVEALEGYRRNHNDNHNDNQPCDAERAGRARLEGKP